MLGRQRIQHRQVAREHDLAARVLLGLAAALRASLSTPRRNTRLRHLEPAGNGGLAVATGLTRPQHTLSKI